MAFLRALAASSCVLVSTAACGHEWDAYDPRADGDAGGGAASTGEGASATSAGGSSGMASTGGAGGAGASASATGPGGSTGASGGAAPVGLVAAYAFDEGAGSTTADATTNHNDGSLV